MSSEVVTVHGTVARVIDTPSQGISYLRVEVPIEYHAELTRQFYGKRVLVVPAGAQMAGQPFGVFNVGDEGVQAPAPDAPAPAAPRATIKAPERNTPPGGALSKSAAMLCDSAAFKHFAWADQAGNDDVPSDFGSGDADAFIKTHCGIASKAELDHNKQAATHFQILMSQYREWLKGRPEYAQ